MGRYRSVALGVLASLAAAGPPAWAAADPRALMDAMARNVGMIEVACPADGGGAVVDTRVCLGPYWSWKEFRKIWDESIADDRRVPEIPLALGAWQTRSDTYERRYRLGPYTVRVAFDRKRESVTIESFGAAGTPGAAPTAAAVADGTPAPSPSPQAPARDLRPGDSAVAFPAVDVEPAVVPESRIPPAYPQQARALRLRARVELTVIVGPDGRPEGVVVDSCSEPGKGFEDAAVDAVTRWKFIAGRRQGQPVRAVTRVALSFAP